MGETAHHAVDEHIAGTGVEGKDLAAIRSRGNNGNVADTPDILQQEGFCGAAVQQVLCVGHQRCALTSGSQIRRAEIGDAGDAGQLGDDGALSDLDGVTLLRRMPDGLPVGADHTDRFRGNPRFRRHGQGSLRIELAQPHIHFAYLVYGGLHWIKEAEDSLPGLLRIRQVKESQKLHQQVSARSGGGKPGIRVAQWSITGVGFGAGLTQRSAA
ncbi:hypothetical protein D3C75_835880 [compost metagenome]